MQPSYTQTGDIDAAKFLADSLIDQLLKWALVIGGIALVVWLFKASENSSSSGGAAAFSEWPWEEWIPRV